VLAPVVPSSEFGRAVVGVVVNGTGSVVGPRQGRPGRAGRKVAVMAPFFVFGGFVVGLAVVIWVRICFMTARGPRSWSRPRQ